MFRSFACLFDVLARSCQVNTSAYGKEQPLSVQLIYRLALTSRNAKGEYKFLESINSISSWKASVYNVTF
jgi:hypothetical protein